MGARRPAVHREKPAAPAPSRLWKAATLAFGVTWLAALIRWWPLTQYNIWGSDAGEYAGLVESYLGSGGNLPDPYTGWGLGYPDFKGMYSVAGTFAQLTGIDSFYVLSIVIPALAGLSALFAFIVTLRLSRSLFAATIAGGIVATAMPEVFSGSHGMPGALGGMLLMAMVAAAVISVRAPAVRWVVVVLALALIPTHHLSAFIGAAAFAAAALLEARFGPGDVERGRIVDVALLGSCTLLMGSAAFWAWGAPQFRAGVLDHTSRTISRILPGVGLLAVVGLVVLAWWCETRPRDRARFSASFDDARMVKRLAAVAIAPLVSLLFLATVGVPGTSAVVPLSTALPFYPLGLVLAAVAAGPARLIPVRGSLLLLGGALGIIASAILGAALLPTVLIPYRHMQYLIDFAAPLSAVALAYAARGAAGVVFPGRRTLARATAAVMVGALLASCTLTAYPSKQVLVGYQEGTTDSEVPALVWLTWDLPASYIASDHRLSSMAYGFAYHDATWEAGGPILTGLPAVAIPALDTVKSPSGGLNVTIVLLSDDIVAGAALSQWDPATPISGPALAKFDSAPFAKVFDNGDAVAYWVARGG